MQESYGADRASHTDPESWAVARKDGSEALTGAWAGGLWSRDILIVRGADAVPASGRPHLRPRHGKRSGDLARSQNPGMHSNTSRENREVPCLPGRGCDRSTPNELRCQLPRLSNFRHLLLSHRHRLRSQVPLMDVLPDATEPNYPEVQDDLATGERPRHA
jgi:hypothetical protein